MTRDSLPSLRPVARLRASREVAEQIKELIVSGNLEPGSRLPSERELVKQLHVGRAVVREALRILEVMGLAKTQQGRGTFITQPLPSNDDAAEIARLALQKIALQDVYEARMGIEPFIASLAAERREPSGFSRLGAALDDFCSAAASSDTDAMVLADLDFHREVGETAGNAVLARTLGLILDPAHHLSRITLRLPGRAPQSIQQHERILEAIRARDPVASHQAMVAHLNSAAHALREAAKKSGSEGILPDAAAPFVLTELGMLDVRLSGDERVHDPRAESGRTVGAWARDLLPEALR